MSRTTRVLAAAAAALVPFAPTAAWAGAVHDHYDAAWEGSETFAAGEGSCVAWAGTFHEVREGGYRLVSAPSGQREGELHVNGAISGRVELVPDEPAFPTYSGDYREKVTGVAYGADAELTRVMTYRLRVPMTGTDGSSFTIVMAGHVTENAAGQVVVGRHTFECR